MPLPFDSKPFVNGDSVDNNETQNIGTTPTYRNAKRVILFDTNGNATTGGGLPAWDYMSLTSGATTDTYVFKTGGSGGTTVQTIVITYTDATKATISTVTKA